MDGCELHLQPWQREASQDIRAITELLGPACQQQLEAGPPVQNDESTLDRRHQCSTGSGEAEGVDTEAANSLPAAANHGHPLPCDQQVVSPSRTFIGAGVPQTEVFS